MQWLCVLTFFKYVLLLLLIQEDWNGLGWYWSDKNAICHIYRTMRQFGKSELQRVVRRDRTVLNQRKLSLEEQIFSALNQWECEYCVESLCLNSVCSYAKLGGISIWMGLLLCLGLMKARLINHSRKPLKEKTAGILQQGNSCPFQCQSQPL